MRIVEKFIELCKKKEYKVKDIQLFKSIIKYSSNYTTLKTRFSGRTFFEFNIQVASVLVENRVLTEIVAASLLYTINTPEQIKYISEKFGKEIGELLKGIDKLKSVKADNSTLEAESLRRVLVTTLNNPKVILLKLANKIINLRTIEYLESGEQKRIAKECIEFYAPIAYRFGYDNLKAELEDLSFKILNPKKYNEIEKYINESTEERKKTIEEFMKELKVYAKENKIRLIKIKGRPKHIYSIYRKIIKRNVKLDKQYDLLGVRLIVKSVKDCYVMLSILIENYKQLNNRFKDYIASPKPNGYQSIHTGIILESGKIIEVQIRTKDMDEYAEEGGASHWSYKGFKSESDFEKRTSWIKPLLELEKNTKTKEFLESVKIDLFYERIYCRTPKGDIISLPKSSTILDFAYHIHQEIGNTCVGGRINGKFVTMKTVLSNNDVVEILTSKNQRPRKNWLKFVTTPKAKQKIRSAIKKYGEIPIKTTFKLKEKIREEYEDLVVSEKFPKAKCILAKCCSPVPDEDIIGIVNKKKVISVHKPDCYYALKESKRWIEVLWKESFNKPINLIIIGKERSGLLADLLNTISQSNFTVRKAKIKMIANNYAQTSFQIFPKSMQSIVELIKIIKKVQGITKIYFD